MQKRVTLQEIGRCLQVHHTTVSRALRNDPSLPAATCRKVQKAAKEMGYRPDPMAKALAVYRQAIRPASQHGTLALLTHGKIPMGDTNLYWESMNRRAGELGYRIEEFPLHAAGMTLNRLNKILKARGTSGILLMNTPRLARLRLDWESFPAVAIGHALLWPPIHRISPNHFRNMKLLVRKLLSLGYRRIGFCVNAKTASINAEGGWLGGYLLEMDRLGPCPRPLYLENHAIDEKKLRSWIQTEGLDAIISDHNASQIAHHSGLRVPEELGVASLAPDTLALEQSFYSGVAQHLPYVGEMAVDFLVHLINTNQRGIPKFPQRLLLDGTWIPGKTVRRINRGKLKKSE